MCLLWLSVYCSVLFLLNVHSKAAGTSKKTPEKPVFKTKAFIAKNALDMKNNQINHESSVQDDA